MSTILNDVEKQKLIQMYQNGEISPKLYRFFKGLDSRETGDTIRWMLFEDLEMSDGSIFRIMGSQRSYEDQHEEYKRGRQLQVVESANASGGIHYNIVSEKIINSREISTKAQAGKSFHNYGLAVDFCFRRFGDNLALWRDYFNNMLGVGQWVITDEQTKKLIRQYFKDTGLKAWADICGVKLGVFWDFFDMVHVEDSDGVKLPDVPYSNMCSYRYLFSTEQDKAIKKEEDKKNGKGETNNTKTVSLCTVAVLVGLAVAFVGLAFN